MKRVAAILIALVWLPGAQVSADTVVRLAQITCAPKLGYLVVRRVLFMNPDADLDAVAPSLGLTSSLALQRKPTECRLLPGARNNRPALTVWLTGQFDVNSNETSYQFIRNFVEILIDGRRMSLVDLNPTRGGVESFEVQFNGVVYSTRICEASADPAEEDQIRCRDADVSKTRPGA